MRGVVIWYSRLDFRAIIWCEDSKELGIAKGATAWTNPMVPVEIGDYVSFRAEARGNERLCRDIRVLETQIAPTLPEVIAKQWHPPTISRNSHLHLVASQD